MVKDLLGGAGLLDEAALYDDNVRSRGMASVWSWATYKRVMLTFCRSLIIFVRIWLRSLVSRLDSSSSISSNLGFPDDGHALALAAEQGRGLPVQILSDVQNLGGFLGNLPELQGEGYVSIHYYACLRA